MMKHQPSHFNNATKDKKELIKKAFKGQFCTIINQANKLKYSISFYLQVTYKVVQYEITIIDKIKDNK